MPLALTADNLVPGGKIVDAGDMSGNLTSRVVDMSGKSILGLHLISASATRAGTWTVEASNNGDDWVTISFLDNALATVASLAVTGSSAFNELATLVDVGMRYIRAVFTNSAGTGTGDVWAVAKQPSKG